MGESDRRAKPPRGPRPTFQKLFGGPTDQPRLHLSAAKLTPNHHPERGRTVRKLNLRLESLADRSLPSASLAGGVLTVTGTDAADRIEVRQHGDTITVR